MIKRPIRDLHSDKQPPNRFCDVIVDDDHTYLEVKRNNKYLKIPWDDVVIQVTLAIKDSNENQELPQ